MKPQPVKVPYRARYGRPSGPDYLALGVAVFGMSQAALVIRWAHAPIEAIGFWRLFAASCLLAPFAWRRRASWRALPARERAAVAGAGVLFFLHLWTFTYSTQNTLISHTMIAFSTHPLWTGAGAWLLFGEALTARVFGAYALAGAGVWALVSAAKSGHAASLGGDAAGFAAALTFSGYVLAGKGARRQLDNAAFASAISAVVCVCFLLTAAARGVALLAPYPWTFWASILALAAGVSIAGHALFSYLLNVLDVNALSCSKLLEPALAAITAWLFLGEGLSGRTLAAFVLVSSAVLLVLWPSRGAPRAEPGELESD
jgi:drug/metabolite transporter (DMT)-like permease